MMLNVLAHPESVLEVGSPKRHTFQNDPAHHFERGPMIVLESPQMHGDTTKPWYLVKVRTLAGVQCC